MGNFVFGLMGGAAVSWFFLADSSDLQDDCLDIREILNDAYGVAEDVHQELQSRPRELLQLVDDADFVAVRVNDARFTLENVCP